MALAACIGAVGSLLGWRQGKRNAVLVEDNNAKTDTLIVKADQIHDATNGGLKKVKDELADHKVQLADAVALIAKLRSIIKGRDE